MDFLKMLVIIRYLERSVELVSGAIFLSDLQKKRTGKIRILLEFAIYASILVFVNIWLLYIPVVKINFVYTIFCLYPIAFLIILYRYKANIYEAVYYTLLMFLATDPMRFSIQLLSQNIFHYNFLEKIYNGSFIGNLICLTEYFVILFLNQFMMKLLIKKHPANDVTGFQLLIMFLSCLPVIFIGNMNLWTPMLLESLPISVGLIDIVCSYCALICIMGYKDIQVLSEKRAELFQMEMILSNQKQQYRLQKETVEILNQKFHDLKNYMICFETEINEEKKSEFRQQYIEDVKEQIKTYESLQNTGNEALDIVLTNKSLECERKNIRLLLLLSGEPLSFMRSLDIASVFGNALDNAIAAVENVPDDYKEIRVRMQEKQGWLSIRFENYCEKEVSFNEDRLPVSTKKDIENHGFGLKSIQTTVQKYDGNVKITCDNHIFALCILFQIQNK